MGKGFVFKEYMYQCMLPGHLNHRCYKGSESFKKKTIHSVRNSNTNTNLENELIHLDNMLSLQSCKNELHINTTLKIRGPTI